MVSAIASAQGNNQMAVGNAVGSVTANTGLIMALSIIFLPHAVNLQRFAPKAIILMGSIFFLAIFSLTGELNIVGTVGMFIIFAIFIIQNLHDAKQSVSQGQISAQDMRIAVSRRDIVRHIVCFVVGTAGIVIGSNLLVDNGTLIADKIFMVDRRIISLTAVAIGTSLPELVTTVTAIAKKQSSLSIGNIMGANIIDLTLIMPVCSIICGGTLKNLKKHPLNRPAIFGSHHPRRIYPGFQKQTLLPFSRLPCNRPLRYIHDVFIIFLFPLFLFPPCRGLS